VACRDRKVYQSSAKASILSRCRSRLPGSGQMAANFIAGSCKPLWVLSREPVPWVRLTLPYQSLLLRKAHDGERLPVTLGPAAQERLLRARPFGRFAPPAAQRRFPPCSAGEDPARRLLAAFILVWLVAFAPSGSRLRRSATSLALGELAARSVPACRTGRIASRDEGAPPFFWR
jgi:hypothetical protein